MNKVDNTVQQRQDLASIHSLISIGKVVALTLSDVDTLTDKSAPQKPSDYATVLVQIGGEAENTYTRNWMPWTVQRGGSDSEWWAPEREDQVVVASISGDPALGIIIGSLYRGQSLQFSPTGDSSIERKQSLPDMPYSRDLHQRYYADGTQMSYNRLLHAFSFDVRADKTPGVADNTSEEDKRKHASEKARSTAPALFRASIRENSLAIESQDNIDDTYPAASLELSPKRWKQAWRADAEQADSIATSELSVEEKKANYHFSLGTTEEAGLHIKANSDGELQLNASSKISVTIGDPQAPQIAIEYDPSDQGDIHITSKGKAALYADDDVTVQGKKQVTVVAEGNVSVLSKKNISLDAETITLTANEMKIAAKTEITKAVTIKANTKIQGGKLDVQ